MSLLRPQLAIRLLQGNVARCQHVAPGGAIWASKRSRGESVEPTPKSTAKDPPAPTPNDSAMIREEGPMEGNVSHQPNYHAPIDHATSLVYIVQGDRLVLIISQSFLHGT